MKTTYGLYTYQCIDYLNQNPGSTGQEVLDHFDVKSINVILNEPITENNINNNNVNTGSDSTNTRRDSIFNDDSYIIVGSIADNWK